MMRLPFLALLLLAAGLPGCAGTGDAEARVPAAERSVTATRWDTAWVRGGTADDTLLLLPLAVAADAERVYVLDGGAKRLVALNASDGALAWTAGRKGKGPGEFTGAVTLAAMPGGGVVVPDHENQRLSVFGVDGSLAREVSFRGVGYVQAVCPLADGSFLLSTLESSRPLVHLFATGEVIARRPLPWPDLDEAPPLARQTILAATPGHRACALGLVLGRGFAVFRDGAFAGPHRYVEWFDLPEVTTRTEDGGRTRRTASQVSGRRIAATELAADDSALFVTFEGEGRDRGRLIDRYDLRTGRYLGTLRYPRPLTKAVLAGGRFLLLHDSGGYPTLLAATPR